ncbi:putative TOS1-like glycosyl hydrolase-domain-containing protein [Lasiosphaeria miniovina]|uniref:glucan endo-1,3-beta-D-glucosidase n=1 Tax=Lasiosphaeria miniovina TaxID=1954250 RepID=A0AA40BHL7_9PEZI|nr:putative TOS1-like glycosyl hydrolase-domain-containing protein [Lasiosphaeria miniovina]KAK0734402.1 putative TOS1-like glycosyl hydrolase-domain-containing protein [Lasiosphaeria miniovina]
MKNNILTTILASASATGAVVSRAATSQDLCAKTSYQQNGNWFCTPVQQITYTNLGGSGTYNDVVGISATGQCEFQPKAYSGPLAPFNEQLSLHFRGPLALRQLAVYTPGPQKKKRDEQNNHNRRHLNELQHHHQNAHGHRRRREEIKAVEERADHPTVWVTATIDGKVVSWINNYYGETPPTPVPVPAEAKVDNSPASAAPKPTPAAQSANNNAAKNSPAAKAPAAAAAGDHVRTGYYSAAAQQANGLTFLGNFGPGGKLSYANSDMSGSSAGPAVLANSTVWSAHEYTVMTDQPCDDGSCGYFPDGIAAFKGFDGADKTFLFEFSMPTDPNPAPPAGSFLAPQFDMPALWMLNAKIARTGQYSACSCWTSNCGEFDVFEVLQSGDDKCKSTFHASPGGGDSNYFPRPLDAAAPIRVAVVFDAASESVSVNVLDPSDVAGTPGQDFPTALSTAQIAELRTGAESSATPGVAGLGAAKLDVNAAVGGGSGKAASYFAIAPAS